MNRKLRIGIIAAAVVAALGGGGVAIAGIGGDDDETERPIEGSALDRASAVALDHTGGGRVTDTEVGDEESYYEVEVTKGGNQIDVQITRDFKVVGDEADSDASEDEGQGED
jgi:hypothetical protein